ncbi:gastric triacylglycerol lipase-like [Sarcophilus harrisii]
MIEVVFAAQQLQEKFQDHTQRPVVFLQHGLLATSIIWVSNLPNNSLGFILADAGFDVWMGNSRGSTYSRKHAFLPIDSKEYWAFSFDEMARYDLPASIDYIVKKTGQKIYYVGHSQGTLTGFLAFSTLPKIVQKVKTFFALAPVFYIRHIKSIPLLQIFSLRQPLFKAFYESRQILQAFDWGSEKENFAHYNQTIPPKYNVSKMKVPTALWSGGKDLLADPEDVSDLIPQIRSKIYHKTLPDYNHLDFIFGIDAPQEIYYEIIKMIKNTL